MARQIIINGIEFGTAKAATEHVRQLLSGARVNCPLAPDEFAFVYDLLTLHPEADQKIGCGVKHIEVRIAGEYNTRCFWIVRHDGTETDFSYRKCMNPEMAARDKFLRACRFAIRGHVEAFRLDFFAVATSPTCPLTGKPITPDNCHVDHIPPYTFDRIVTAFCTLNGIDINDARHTLNGIDGMMIPLLSNPITHDRFIQFHNSLASYRVISVEANTSLVPLSMRRAA